LAHLGLHYKISPEELSEEQIQDYLYHCKNLHNTPSESFFKHTVYGLRSVYKVLGLKDKRISLPQIKAQNSLPVVLSKQKGNYDRYVPLSDLLIRGLKKYISTESPVAYLFNSQVTDNGKPRGLSSSSIQWVIKESRSKVDTSKKITAHTLRHTYATHLLEEGLNIMALKELLGHARIETTILYLHVTNTGNSIKFSPLDRLYQ
jgi:integrase/recombinase XerD